MVYPMAELITHYLEISSEEELNGCEDPGGITVSKCLIKQFQFNRFLYQFIGEKWLWRDKNSWDDQMWADYVLNENLHTWVAYCEGSIAGYFELVQVGTEVEIVYFGLAAPFIGRGYGGYLLTEAIQSAFSLDRVERVWLHTCTLDHPHALKNYLARGMKLYRSESDAA